MIKKVLLTAIFLAIIFLPHNRSFALEDCSGKTGDDATNCWASREKELKALISQSQGQQRTLADAIEYFNNQISLTQAQIYQTEQELKTLEEDIITLSVKISRLDGSLNDTAKLLVTRVGESYKRSAFNPHLNLLNSGGLTDFLERNKYLEVVQQNDRKLMLELQGARNINQQQKDEKEVKQVQIETTRQRLAQERATLNSQNLEKQRLLEATRNDEKRYQSLLAEAQAQKAAFGRFVSRFGGASILSNQTKCDDWGCYYNQRDGQWGNQSIGLSDSSMANYGCLVTSMAMIASYYDKSLTPGQIASSSNPFWLSTAYMVLGDSWTVNGVTMNRKRIGYSTSAIDSELEASRPVIVGIYGGPDHFLVIKEKKDGDYIVHDPFPAGASNVKFTDRYPLSAIATVDRVTVN